MRPRTGAPALLLPLLLLLGLLVLPGATPAAADSKVLHLSIGDPERRDREVPVVLDAVTDTATGDLLLALDGEPLPDRETLQWRMADKRWGDAATLTVEREGEAVEVPMVFRREAPGGE